MATAAADARGTTCSSIGGNKGIVSSTSSNFPLPPSRGSIPPNSVAPSNNLNYLSNMSRANAQQGNPAFQDLSNRSQITGQDKQDEHHHHSMLAQQQRCGSLEDCSVLGNRTPPPPPPPANG